MWVAAVRAIQENKEEWIQDHHLEFKSFFRKSNLKPLGKLDDDALQVHYRNRLFKMYVSPSYNGLGLPLHQGAQWIENAARLDGNWGWLLGIGVGGAYFVDYMDPEIAGKFFTPENALVAGSGMPNGSAKPVKEGWEINGSWDFCSGCEQASMITAVAEKNGQMVALVMPPEAVEIDPTWDTYGMQFTCSHTVHAKQIKIPENHFFDLSKTPGKSDYPLSKYPFLAFAQVCFAPVVAGIAFSLFWEAQQLLEQKRTAWQKRQPERVTKMMSLIDQFEKQYDQKKVVFYTAVEESWKELIQGKSVGERRVANVSTDWAEYCYRSVATILPYLGMAVLKKNHSIQKMWQNLQVGYQHSSLRSET